MKIAVLFTTRCEINPDWKGRDTNEDVDSVIKALKELGHEVVNYEADIELYGRLMNDKDIGLAFNLCDEGFFNKAVFEPHVPAMLDILNVPYTGGDYFSLAITSRKDYVKKILMHHKLPTPKFQVFCNGFDRLGEGFKFPLIVKPSREEGSIGIKDDSVVRNIDELKIKVGSVLKEYRQPVLVEEFIEGREFNVGVIGNGEVLPISEIRFDGMPPNKPKIVNYDAKWKKDSVDYEKTKRECPAKIDEELAKKLGELSVQAGSFFGCRDYFRVDFRVNEKNEPFILEINQNPDISEDAGLAAMAKAKGYLYKNLIAKIIENAVRNYDNKK